jgi:hypothetical protein
MSSQPDTPEASDQVDADMAAADQANGERPPEDVAVNDSEERYGSDESPA